MWHNAKLFAPRSCLFIFIFRTYVFDNFVIEIYFKISARLNELGWGGKVLHRSELMFIPVVNGGESGVGSMLSVKVSLHYLFFLCLFVFIFL